MKAVEVMGSRIIIRELILEDPEAAGALAEVLEEERPGVTRQALRLGLILRRQAATALNVDFVKLEFERLKGDIEAYWREHVIKPIGETIKTHFDPGTGTVPAHLARLFGDGKDSGKLAALFDEKNTESVTYKLRALLEHELTGESSAFRRALNPDDAQSPIGQLKSKLEGGIQALRDAVVGKKGAEEAAETGTQKGGPYEDLVFRWVDRIAAGFGDKADDVSNRNVPGDYLVTLDPETVPAQTLRIAIDAKDKTMGLKACEDTLREAKVEWQAHAALLVFARDEETPFASPVGLRRLSEGYVCVFHKEDLDARVLQAAYQVVRLEATRAVQRSVTQVDAAAVQVKLEQAVQKLQEFVMLKRRLTAAVGELAGIRQFVDTLHLELTERLEEAWEAIGVRTPMPTKPEPV
jgi:hypothetical protein